MPTKLISSLMNKYSNKKHIIYVVIFCFYVSIYYLNTWSNLFYEFEESLAYYSEYPKYLNSFQHWTFNILGILIDAFVIALSVGIFSYFFRAYKIYVYILLGLLIRYSILVSFLIYSFPFDISNTYSEYFIFKALILLLLQFASVIYASYLGFKIGAQTEYYEAQDKSNFSIFGISKKIWSLIIILTFPLVNFLFKFSIVNIYSFTKKLSSSEYWSDILLLKSLFNGDLATGIYNLLIHILVILFVWIISLSLILYGIKTIKEKKSKYRRVKIFLIFIFIPLAILTIPILRNKTWFF